MPKNLIFFFLLIEVEPLLLEIKPRGLYNELIYSSRANWIVVSDLIHL